MREYDGYDACDCDCDAYGLRAYDGVDERVSDWYGLRVYTSELPLLVRVYDSPRDAELP